LAHEVAAFAQFDQTLILRLRHYSIEVQWEDKARVVFFLGGDITFEKKSIYPKFQFIFYMNRISIGVLSCIYDLMKYFTTQVKPRASSNPDVHFLVKSSKN